MIVYFDTSALLPIIIEEAASQSAARLWDVADRVVSSRLIYPEGRAALAMASRMGRIGESELRSAVDDLEALFEQLDLVEVTERVSRRAGGLAEEFGLRGYDAVHLASAQQVADSELVLAASDRNLVAAARALGLATANLVA